MLGIDATTVYENHNTGKLLKSTRIRGKMTDFLNKFHLSTRHRLSLINERIGWCERMLDNVEAIVLPQEN